MKSKQLKQYKQSRFYGTSMNRKQRIQAKHKTCSEREKQPIQVKQCKVFILTSLTKTIKVMWHWGFCFRYNENSRLHHYIDNNICKQSNSSWYNPAIGILCRAWISTPACLIRINWIHNKSQQLYIHLAFRLSFATRFVLITTINTSNIVD